MRRRGSAPLALAALLAAGACAEGGPASGPASAPAARTAAPAPPRLLDVTALDAAVKRNLQRGAIVALWATW
jgi:hypothetical protein